MQQTFPPLQVTTQTSANVYSALGVDNSWSFEEFAETFQIKINSLRGDTMEFDMIGADPSIANALRRILIADVPTMAIEHVFMVNNTSIIQVGACIHEMEHDASQPEMRWMIAKVPYVADGVRCIMYAIRTYCNNPSRRLAPTINVPCDSGYQAKGLEWSA